jgi:hypothetical protein
MDLEHVRAALETGASRDSELDAGVYEVTRQLAIGRDGFRLRGGGGEGGRQAILRRGRLEDGALFPGPLLRIAGCGDVVVSGIRFEGRRFEGEGARAVDHRHPLDPDRTSARFPCGAVRAPPACYDPANFGSAFEADILVGDCNGVELHDLVLEAPIVIGIAIGPGAHDIQLRATTIRKAGQFGLWIGAALPTRPMLPLGEADAARLPLRVRVEDCAIADCGAAGASMEGRDIAFRRTAFRGNHRDFPFNDAGGQVVIDYKSEVIRLEGCTIRGESSLRRMVAQRDAMTGAIAMRPESFGAVGIEASGSNLAFTDCVIEGMAREAMHFDGAHGVRIDGAATRLEGNHLAARRGEEPWVRGPRFGIAITTSSGQRDLGAIAGDFRVEGIRCEGGILVWSDGSVPGLRIDGIHLVGADLRAGPDTAPGGLVAGLDAAGHSLQGRDWTLEKPRRD